MRRIGLGVGVLAAPLIFTNPAAAQNAGDFIDLISKVSNRFDDFWNHQDPTGLGELFAKDCTLVTPSGPIMGRDKVVEAMAARMGSTIHISKVDEFRPLNDNSVWVVGEYQIRNLDGSERSSGYWAAIEGRDGRSLQIQDGVFNVTPR